MNTIFKVGDTAEFTERYMGHNVGDRFTVTAVEPSVTGPNTQLVQGRRPDNYSGVFSHRLKLVEPAKHEYKVGDKVEVLEKSMWHEAGPGVVKEVDGGILRVKQSQHTDCDGRWLLPRNIRPLVEEPAKTELKFEVGARVRSKNGFYGAAEGTVTRLDGPFGGDIEIAWDKGAALAGATLGARRVKLEVIAPAPSPTSTKKKATLVDDKNKPQIGDTIVAFWEKNGVETRKKGVVASIDSDGDYETSEGEYINYDGDTTPENAPHVYIVERAPRPEPVKVDPNQKWIDAPIGSIAKHTSCDFVWRKTANNEWSLLTSSGNVILDRNDSTVGARAVLFTP